MSWYKQARNFHTRNVIIGKIQYLKDLREQLDRISDLIFQSAKNAQAISRKIASSDKITSYPDLHETILEADSLAYDSPWKFQKLCQIAIEDIDVLIRKLTKQRKEWTEGEKAKPKKGWI